MEREEKKIAARERDFSLAAGMFVSERAPKRGRSMKIYS